MAEVSEEEFLQHFGVPGMKWGKRSASSGPAPTRGERRAARIDASAARGEARIQRNHGSATRSQFASVGKQIIADVLLGAGAQKIGSLSGNPKVAAGANIVAGIISTAHFVKNLRDIQDVSNASRARINR